MRHDLDRSLRAISLFERITNLRGGNESQEALPFPSKDTGNRDKNFLSRDYSVMKSRYSQDSVMKNRYSQEPAMKNFYSRKPVMKNLYSRDSVMKNRYSREPVMKNLYSKDSSQKCGKIP